MIGPLFLSPPSHSVVASLLLASSKSMARESSCVDEASLVPFRNLAGDLSREIRSSEGVGCGFSHTSDPLKILAGGSLGTPKFARH